MFNQSNLLKNENEQNKDLKLEKLYMTIRIEREYEAVCLV